MKPREKFDKVVTFIKRDGIEDLIRWLENETDFFSAPASGKFHGNHTGGLLEHSLNVLDYALVIFNHLIKVKPHLEYLRESVVISALFHDVCKVNIYVQEKMWTKNSDNRWVEYVGWKFDDDFPMGHGEKSVFLIQKHMELENEEAMAIRWHMGTFEAGTTIPGLTQYSYNKAWERPLVKLIHAADLMAPSNERTVDYKAMVQT